MKRCVIFAGCVSIVVSLSLSVSNAQEKNGNRAADSQAKILRDIEYSRPDDKPQLLDLYLPQAGDGPFPIVVWVHGGGWKNGSKKNCPASWLVEHGFAVASINYRLIPAQWPAQIDDCRAAVRWLRFHADQYHLDPNHIGVWGGSAGGHLVALMGTLPPPEVETSSSAVQAVCDWYGPSDLLTMPPNVVSETRTQEQVAQSNGAKLLGAPVWTIPEKAKQASAFHQVSKDDAPFLIMHGDRDPAVPLIQSEKLHDALQKKGVESTLVVLKGAGHGGKQFRNADSKQTILKFFEKHLKP
ncbi:MAG: alpha/beta hydrolase [Planctomycetaceae bacterium]|nr:alpha/beta hydrolase [Planctomycetaceae bacterium]